MYRVGADEAGKGPVLGPMVAAAVRAEPTALPDGVDDSKRLTPERRASLAAQLRAAEDVDAAVAVVEPERIDDPETDMNTLTVAAQAEAIAAAARSEDAVVVDAGDVSESRFARRVREAVGDGGRAVRVDAEHGADGRYALVGAASVLAKIERDARIDALAERYGDVGSGYPSDPTTRRFLAEFIAERGRLPDCARASWQTAADALAAAEQSALDDF